MSKATFEQFLNDNASKKQKEEEKFNPEKEKQEWLGFIEIFYDQIKNWLKPFIDDGRMSINFVPKNITEEYIGTYSVENMDVMFVGQKLTFEPIGTLLIGTKGRIDLIGPKGSVQFILVDQDSTELKVRVSIRSASDPAPEEEPSKKIEWTWKIIERTSSRIKYIDFSEDNFFDALMGLVNG